MSGGQRSILKNKLQVCESQKSCLFVGDQVLVFHRGLRMNSLRVLRCDFLDFFPSVCLSWLTCACGGGCGPLSSFWVGGLAQLVADWMLFFPTLCTLQ
ncbi:hypothetical protein J4Q44_G00091840, partial [Coregonus suidteri]